MSKRKKLKHKVGDIVNIGNDYVITKVKHGRRKNNGSVTLTVSPASIEHADEILKGLNEANQIHSGEKSGVSFDDFLEDF